MIVVNAATWPRYERAARIAAWCTVVPLFVWAAVFAIVHGRLGLDCHAYWAAWHRGQLYTVAPTKPDAYLYSPAFAQLIRPLALLPWPVFGTLWLGGEMLLVGWLVWPLCWGWRVPLFALCLPELFLGNVHALFALVLIYGFRRPGWWALPLLTKVTPAVGFMWFAARREWRQFGKAVAWTAGIVAVSAAIDPGAWVDWIRFLLDHAGGGPRGNTVWTVIHYTVAAILLGYAITRQRRLMLVLAMVLAAPVTYFAPLAVLAALPRMRVPNDESSSPEPRRQGEHAERRTSVEDLKAGGELNAEPEHEPRSTRGLGVTVRTVSIKGSSPRPPLAVAHAEPRPVREMVEARLRSSGGHSYDLPVLDTASVGAVSRSDLYSHDSAGEP